MKEEGGEEKVRLSRKRKPQEQEQHFDDCGSDFEVLEESALLASRLRENPESGCYFEVDEHSISDRRRGATGYHIDVPVSVTSVSYTHLTLPTKA